MSSSARTTAGRRPWAVFGLVGAVATVLYLLDLSPVLDSACALTIGLGTVWACFTSPPKLGAEPRTPFRLLGAAGLLFLIGVIVRPIVHDAGVPLVFLDDAMTVPGYLLTAAFLITLLQARHSLERHAVLDGLIVCLSAGLTSMLLLGLPAAEYHNRPAAESVLAGIYPLFDTIVLLLVINVTFTARVWPVSLRTLMGTMSMLLVGDTAYAVIGVSGKTYTSPMLDVPFLVAYTLLGVTVLHPSVVDLGRATRRPVQAWSPRRIALLAPALVAPFLLLVLVGHSASRRWSIAATGAVIMLLLLARAVSAVRAQAEAQQQAEHQALHDPLTGFPNRAHIVWEVEQRLGNSGPDVWVYLLDLDGFKWVNDSWGHDTGDQLVIEVGARLRAVAPADVPVARVGGDEFVLAYSGDEAGALTLLEEIRGCFGTPYRIRENDLPIAASIGISHAPAGEGDAAVTAEALIRDADTAMYRAKGEGPGNSTVFDSSMYDQARERIELEVALRQALAHNELHVVYQPIVRVTTGVPLGAEALLRWIHPTRGTISPAVFIPIAEQAGLIEAIGTWVRREALRQLGEWRRTGVVVDDFYLSINVSPKQLGEAELPLIISAEMIEFGVPSHAVALEMTESVMVDGSTVTGRVLFELRELGLKLLIDDFGTGFSALGYLRKFPVTGVKIDRSFVIGLGADAQDEEIVRAVVAMSFALGLNVIAEGVETRLQRDALAALGVTHGQGWLWGPGVRAAEFAEHWHANRATALAARGDD